MKNFFRFPDGGAWSPFWVGYLVVVYGLPGAINDALEKIVRRRER